MQVLQKSIVQRRCRLLGRDVRKLRNAQLDLFQRIDTHAHLEPNPRPPARVVALGACTVVHKYTTNASTRGPNRCVHDGTHVHDLNNKTLCVG